MVHPVIDAELFFEFRDGLAEDEGLIFEDPGNRRIDLGLDGMILGFQVNKWHAHGDPRSMKVEPFEIDELPAILAGNDDDDGVVQAEEQ